MKHKAYKGMSEQEISFFKVWKGTEGRLNKSDVVRAYLRAGGTKVRNPSIECEVSGRWDAVEYEIECGVPRRGNLR